MKLLIITQKVDRNDPVLGFFHRWLEEFAKHFEKVTVICLEKGEFDLPENIKVFSLGKEEKNFQFSIFNFQKIRYTLRFYKYLWTLRGDYDAVFVHMNQEYVLLGWKLWKLWGKKIYLWRNHAKGSLWTRLAVLLSRKVFYTSPQSFTARFRKSVQMPAGIDTDFFKPDPTITRKPNSVLFLGRISPVKKVLEFIEWLKTTSYVATIAGPILAEDRAYGDMVKNALNEHIAYVGPVDQAGALRLYQTHEIYVNMTSAGSLDKTILEAAACGMKLKIENPHLKELEGKTGEEARDFMIKHHRLSLLVDKLAQILNV
ncbi:MAG: hypothetical protein AAB780_02190 [Patescibacteria group bacterium]